MFLGVDGGGTKTAYALVAEDGTLLAARSGPGLDHLADGLEVVRARLRDGVAATLAEASATLAQLRFAFVGIPAYGEDSRILRELDALPSAALGGAPCRCGNDMLCSWAGSLACEDGISVVAGTGSLAYGEFEGRQARCGGWGELIGDEGSAYWIAREGMNLFSRMSDGRAARGALHGLVRERLGITDDLDLCARIYGARADRRAAFAQFAPLVHDAARAGDAAAAAIFVRAAAELLECVLAVRRALGVPRAAALAISHTGGVFGNAPALVAAFRDALAAAQAPFEYRAPRLPPAAGAALYAARCAGTPLPPAAIARLEARCATPGAFP